MTRREFLEMLTTLSVASLAGAACSRVGPMVLESSSPAPLAASSPTPSPTSQPTATSTPARVRAALVRGPQLRASVARAVKLAGGLTGFKSGAVVLIKPNVNSDDPYPATTNPDVVRAVVEVVEGYNPRRIIVADRSNAAYATLRAMQKLGIYEEAAA